MNKANFLGYIAFDMEVKETQYGKKYLQNTLNVRRSFKGSDGKYGYDHIPFTIYGQSAEQLAKYSKKGDLIILSGAMATSQYSIQAVDSKTGQIKDKKISTMNLNVDSFEFLPRIMERSESNKESAGKSRQYSHEELYHSDDNLPHI